MTISSRTPEGTPHRCPVCDQESAVEPSYPGGDSCCPACGHLLWWFRDRLSAVLGAKPERITLSTSIFGDLGADSIGTVELIMELEEGFDVAIPADEAARIKTVADAIRSLRRRQTE